MSTKPTTMCKVKKNHEQNPTGTSRRKKRKEKGRYENVPKGTEKTHEVSKKCKKKKNTCHMTKTHERTATNIPLW